MVVQRVFIAGAGVFGAGAAVELAARGYSVTLADPGLGRDAEGALVPAPLAESTDISKVVRLDYGGDLATIARMEVALAGWREWSAAWAAEGLDPVFHEGGVMFLSRAPLAPGGFEAECVRGLAARGHTVERLGGAALRARCPAWNADRYPDGYYNPVGGYAESGRVVARLLARAERAGVEVLAGVGFAELVEAAGRVRGARLTDGAFVEADRVVLATGSWTGHLLPALQPALRSTGQPVFHLLPADPEPYRPERFPVFGADISRTGWYGFPIGREGVVKIGNHGVGRPMHPDGPERETTEAEEARLRAFLADTFPGLADAPIVHRRVCVYGDSHDGQFWIDADPARPGLVVAAGGSGHAFKFAPLVGAWIADVVEGRPDPSTDAFRWRDPTRTADEAARAR